MAALVVGTIAAPLAAELRVAGTAAVNAAIAHLRTTGRDLLLRAAHWLNGASGTGPIPAATLQELWKAYITLRKANAMSGASSMSPSSTAMASMLSMTPTHEQLVGFFSAFEKALQEADRVMVHNLTMAAQAPGAVFDPSGTHLEAIMPSSHQTVVHQDTGLLAEDISVEAQSRGIGSMDPLSSATRTALEEVLNFLDRPITTYIATDGNTDLVESVLVQKSINTLGTAFEEFGEDGARSISLFNGDGEFPAALTSLDRRPSHIDGQISFEDGAPQAWLRYTSAAAAGSPVDPAAPEGVPVDYFGDISQGLPAALSANTSIPYIELRERGVMTRHHCAVVFGHEEGNGVNDSTGVSEAKRLSMSAPRIVSEFTLGCTYSPGRTTPVSAIRDPMPTSLLAIVWIRTRVTYVLGGANRTSTAWVPVASEVQRDLTRVTRFRLAVTIPPSLLAVTTGILMTVSARRAVAHNPRISDSPADDIMARLSDPSFQTFFSGSTSVSARAMQAMLPDATGGFSRTSPIAATPEYPVIEALQRALPSSRIPEGINLLAIAGLRLTEPLAVLDRYSRATGVPAMLGSTTFKFGLLLTNRPGGYIPEEEYRKALGVLAARLQLPVVAAG